MACENGHSKIAEMIFQKSAELNIDLNAKDRMFDRTAFHLACENSHSKLSRMPKIDLAQQLFTWPVKMVAQ